MLCKASKPMTWKNNKYINIYKYNKSLCPDVMTFYSSCRTGDGSRPEVIYADALHFSSDIELDNDIKTVLLDPTFLRS